MTVYNPDLGLLRLREESKMGLRGGLYHATQIKLCYNSNRIEGSRLSEEQTRFIFETNSINAPANETLNVDDIIEAANHFSAFDYMLKIADKPLSSAIIKELHRLIKSGTSDGRKSWFRVGAYKMLPNTVGGAETTPPSKVGAALNALIAKYRAKETASFYDIVSFHYHFERIHPFQDGNGRVGRLILFKECLSCNLTPFIIDEKHKLFYYRGLKEFEKTPGFLLDTCRSAQDDYLSLINYFSPP
jgi:Fic family protein